MCWQFNVGFILFLSLHASMRLWYERWTVATWEILFMFSISIYMWNRISESNQIDWRHKDFAESWLVVDNYENIFSNTFISVA